MDELVTVDAIRYDFWGHLWEAPLLPYYGLMWAWSIGGHFTTDVWLRTASITAVTIAVIFTSETARRLRGSRAGLIAGLTLALTPSAIRYAHEVRPYAFALALAALATWALTLGARGTRRWPWVAYASSMALLALVMPVGLAILAAHGVLVVTSADRRNAVRRWILATATILPVVLVEFLAMSRFSDLHFWLPRPTLIDVPPGIVWLTTSFAEHTATGLVFGVVAVVIGLTSPQGARWIGAALASLAAVWIVSALAMSWWYPRSMVPLTGLVAVAIGLSLAERARSLSVLLVGVLGVLAVQPALDSWRPGSREMDLRQAVSIMDDLGRPGDRIQFDPTQTRLWYAVRQYSSDSTTFTPSGDPSVRWWTSEEEPSCMVIRQWTLRGDESLTLCADETTVGRS